MENVREFIAKEQSKVLKKTGAFWAFNDAQFLEQKKPNEEYMNMGAGLVCPVKNAKELNNELVKVYHKGIEMDLELHSKEAIIKRELYNHECFYTNDFSDCIEKLKDYPISPEEIENVYFAEIKKNSKY